MMRKAVIFDLDDTISDHQHSRRSALTALVEHFPVMMEKDVRKLEVIHERHLQVSFDDLLSRRIQRSEARRERMRGLFSEVGLPLSEEELTHADSIYRSAYDTAYRAVPGAVPLIKALKKMMKVAILTNGLVARQESKIRLCGLEGQFDAVVVSEQVGVKKPGLKMFQHALSVLNISADEAVMIGDSWASDVLGANNAGIPAVWFNRYEEQCPEPGLAVEITSLEATENLVRILSGSGGDRGKPVS